MWHPDEGTLNALLDGEVPSAEARQLDEHFAQCAECRERLESAREFRSEALTLIGQLDEAPAVPTSAAAVLPGAERRAPPPPRTSTEGRARRRWSPTATRLAWAASVLLAASLGYLAQGRRSAPSIEADAPASLALGDSLMDKLVADQGPPTEPSASTEEREAAVDEGKAVGATRQTETDSPTGKASESAAAGAAKREQPVPASAAPARESLVSTPAAEPSAPAQSAKRLDPAPALLRVRDAAGRAGNAAVAGKELTLLEATSWLGGSIRLVEGWTPERFELIDPKLRVHYATSFGAVVLEQWRVGDALATALVAPPSAPKDTVVAWERRVK